ncbi:ABC transporter permease [Companilactobacillus metriopterae]|uniref:ABC transporter permease n=1 Tax=Companilactobacillus metriopterae TaxID=1909267 RepID=UPI00100C00CB|nr:ABC transporter permease [Companilactobacillus metriopterae]
MYTELRHELYKLIHRKLPWLVIIIMILFMIIMGIGMGSDYGKLLVMTSYNSSQIILLLLVIVGSTIFSMEFQNKTILTLLYRSKNKSSVFLAKFFTLIIYSILLHVIAMIVTIIFNMFPLINNPVSLNSIYKYHQYLFVNMLMTTGVDIVVSILIISLICLTSCLINSNTIVIVINAIIIFMGSGLSSNLLNANVRYVNIVRWNPLNMLNLTTQYYNYSTYHLTSMLSNIQLLMGTILYAMIFLLLGYFVFRKKKF